MSKSKISAKAWTRPELVRIGRVKTVETGMAAGTVDGAKLDKS